MVQSKSCFAPCNQRGGAGEELDRPHPQPEAQRPAHHGDEAQGREGGVEGFSYSHLMVQGQVKFCVVSTPSIGGN